MKGRPFLLSLHAEDDSEIRTVMLQSRLIPVDPAVREHNDRRVIAIPVLVDVFQVIAIVAVRVTQQMDISKLGMENVFEGQGNLDKFDAAVRSLPRDVSPAVLERSSGRRS